MYALPCVAGLGPPEEGALARLLLLRDGETRAATAVGELPVHIGRGSGNELLVSDATVSSHHALVWMESGRLWAKDLSSSNGTFINERRVWGAHPLSDGDHLRLGVTCTFLVESDLLDELPSPGRVLEDVEAGICYPIRGGWITLGPHANVDAAEVATILVHADGEIWLGLDDGGRPVAIGEVFSFDGRSWRVADGGTTRTVTEMPATPAPAYRMVVTLDAPFGPEAVIEDPMSRASCKVDAANRATLLFILGKRFNDDTSAAPDDRGWTPDEEVLTGIWGRKGDENKLNVLLHRLRTDLRTAGLDPWFIEKKQRFLRVRVAEVVIK